MRIAQFRFAINFHQNVPQIGVFVSECGCVGMCVFFLCVES